jgi:hypothetical protein
MQTSLNGTRMNEEDKEDMEGMSDMTTSGLSKVLSREN